MPGFIVCQSCGTQIKVGRQYCLRCGEALHDENAPVRVPMSVSLGLSRNHLLAVVGTASLVVIALLVVIWRTQPVVVDDVAPTVVAQAPRVRPAPAAGEEAVAQASLAPTTPNASAAQAGSSVDAKRAGTAAFAGGNFEAARQAFELALAKQPDDVDALNHLGQTLVRLGKVSEAIPRFERAVALAPDKALFHFNLAHAAGQLGQWDRAITSYREAARLFPEDYATQYNLAMALQRKGDLQGAIPEFQKAIALAPGEPTFHLSLGMSLEKVGRVADAVREYKTYLEMDPAAPEAPQLKAHLEALASGRATRPSSAS